MEKVYNKYDIGQTVYRLYDNKIQAFKIHSFKVTGNDPVTVTYGLHNGGDNNPESSLFETSEHLIKDLLRRSGISYPLMTVNDDNTIKLI